MANENDNYSTIEELENFTPDKFEQGDNIDFGFTASQNGIVQVIDEPSPSQDPSAQDDDAPFEKPVSHSGTGGTLMIDSPLLLAEEESAQPSSHTDHSFAIIVLVIVLAVSGLLIFALYLMMKPQEPDPVPEVVQEVTATPDYQPLKTQFIPLSIKPKYSNILINGVFYDPTSDMSTIGSYPLLTEHDNVIAVYSDGYVPFITRIHQSNNYDEDPVDIQLADDEFYQHSNVTLKLPDSLDLSTTRISLNGKSLLPMPEIKVDCVSGFPNFVLMEARDFGKHLHVFWPIHTNESVQLPELQPQNNANVVTIFTLKLPKSYEQDHTLKIDVKAENEHHTSTGSIRIKKGEFIDVSIVKNGRYPMNLAFDSTPFGSITIDGYMQPSSKGVATVRFSKQSDKSVKLCFRRSSEVICTDEAETMVSSGKWELIAFREKNDGSREIFKEQPFETLKASYDYVFTVSAKGDSFKYSFTEKNSP